MGMTFRLPEVRIERKGAVSKRVLYDPCKDGEPAFDLTNLRVLEVSRTHKEGDLPTVKLTIIGRLVEVEVDE